MRSSELENRTNYESGERISASKISRKLRGAFWRVYYRCFWSSRRVNRVWSAKNLSSEGPKIIYHNNWPKVAIFSIGGAQDFHTSSIGPLLWNRDDTGSGYFRPLSNPTPTLLLPLALTVSQALRVHGRLSRRRSSSRTSYNNVAHQVLIVLLLIQYYQSNNNLIVWRLACMIDSAVAGSPPGNVEASSRRDAAAAWPIRVTHTGQVKPVTVHCTPAHYLFWACKKLLVHTNSK